MASSGDLAKVFVFLQHGLSLESWITGHSPDELNAPTPYGYGAASSAVDMSWSKDADETRLRRLFRRGLRKVLGFDLVHAWHNRRALDAADVVWTHTEWESLAALAVLAVRRNRSTRVIAQSVWIWDEWYQKPAALRWLQLRLLDRAAVEITHSNLNRDLSRRIRGRGNVFTAAFGAGFNSHLAERVASTVAPRSGGYVLAVGSDRHRDWDTLHGAARLLPDVEFRVATLNPNYPRESAPPNVHISSASSLEESYRSYTEAAVVALPLVANLHVSGCTVALESQSLNVPLVTTPVGGLDTYLGSSGVTLYVERDARSLAEAIAASIAAPDITGLSEGESSFISERGLTADDYVGRYVLLTEWLMTGSPDPAQVEAAVPVREVLTERLSQRPGVGLGG